MKVAQLYPTLCDPMDYTVHGILQARILEWVAFPFSRGSSQHREFFEGATPKGRKQCQTLFWGAPKSLQMVTAAMKLKDAYSLEGKL